MKKLATLMLGMALATGCVAVSFGQENPPKKEKKQKKKKAPKAPKKDGGK